MQSPLVRGHKIWTLGYKLYFNKKSLDIVMFIRKNLIKKCITIIISLVIYLFIFTACFQSYHVIISTSKVNTDAHKQKQFLLTLVFHGLTFKSAVTWCTISHFKSGAIIMLYVVSFSCVETSCTNCCG